MKQTYVQNLLVQGIFIFTSILEIIWNQKSWLYFEIQNALLIRLTEFEVILKSVTHKVGTFIQYF